MFLVYLAVWIAYSIPSFRLKSVPIIDFIVSGIGAGLLPFLIGVAASSQLNVIITIKNPTAENVACLQKAAIKYGIIIMAIVGAYVLVGKILGL